MTAQTINRFYTLNLMQKSVSKFHSTTWELRAKVGNRSRCVSFIRKDAHGYTVTMTGYTYKTFMAALASLIGFFINEVWNLVKSDSPLNHTGKDISDSVKRMLNNPASIPAEHIDLSVPHRPTYDRGPKKEYLHPLRKAVTKLIGLGKYSR